MEKKNVHPISLILLILITCLLVSLFAFQPTKRIQAESAGYALQFDGVDDFVQLASNLEILGTGWRGQKSVNLWVKPASSKMCAGTDPASCAFIFGDHPHWWGITIGEITSGPLAGQNRIWVWNVDSNYNFLEDVIGIPYTLNEWVNIALVHERVDDTHSILRAYKNGVEVRNTSSGPTGPDSSNPDPSIQYFGGLIRGGCEKLTFEGQIDELRIWNRAVSASEITSNLYNTIPGDSAGLAAYYQMSDGSGTTVTDDSQFNWSGKILDGTIACPGNGTPAAWVPSSAFDGQPSATSTATSTGTATSAPTFTATATATNTAVVTSTATATATATTTAVPQRKLYLPLSPKNYSP